MFDPIPPKLSRRALLACVPAVLTARISAATLPLPNREGFTSETLIEARKPNGIHLVIAPEGFQEAERVQFLKHAEKCAHAIREQEPFASHWERVKVSVAWSASRECGIARTMEYDAQNEKWFSATADKDTTFQTVLHSGRYVVEVGDFHALRGVRAAIAEPIDNLIVLVNDTRYGGGARPAIDMPSAAYHAHRTHRPIAYDDAVAEFTFGLTVVTCVPRVGGRVLIHELGHSFANLGEEYFDPSAAFRPTVDHPALKKPNVSLWAEPEKVKWKELLGRDRVGAFEGAEGFGRGLFRPWDDGCVMRRAEHKRFCPVCHQAILAEMERLIEQRAK